MKQKQATQQKQTQQEQGKAKQEWVQEEIKIRQRKRVQEAFSIRFQEAFSFSFPIKKQGQRLSLQLQGKEAPILQNCGKSQSRRKGEMPLSIRSPSPVAKKGKRK